MGTKVYQVIKHKRAAFSGLGEAWRTLFQGTLGMSADNSCFHVEEEDTAGP